jgi:hypothetical protein
VRWLTSRSPTRCSACKSSWLDEEASGVGADLLICVGNLGLVVHQLADFDRLAGIAGGGNPMPGCHDRNLDTPTDQECVRSDEQGLWPLARDRIEGSLDLADAAGFDRLNPQPQLGRRRARH